MWAFVCALFSCRIVSYRLKFTFQRTHLRVVLSLNTPALHWRNYILEVIRYSEKNLIFPDKNKKRPFRNKQFYLSPLRPSLPLVTYIEMQKKQICKADFSWDFTANGRFSRSSLAENENFGKIVSNRVFILCCFGVYEYPPYWRWDDIYFANSRKPETSLKQLERDTHWKPYAYNCSIIVYYTERVTISYTIEP